MPVRREHGNDRTSAITSGLEDGARSRAEHLHEHCWSMKNDQHLANCCCCYQNFEMAIVARTYQHRKLARLELRLQRFLRRIEARQTFTEARNLVCLVKRQRAMDIKFARHHKLDGGLLGHRTGFVLQPDIVDYRNEFLRRLFIVAPSAKREPEKKQNCRNYV